jgi:potassium-transporting ATPase ATP-binding subunit
VIAKSGRAVEAAGDVHVLLLDKTGTITFGNRQAAVVLPAPGRQWPRIPGRRRVAGVPGRRNGGRPSIVVPAAEALRPQAEPSLDALAAVPFSAQTRMSGVDCPRAACSARARCDSLLAFIGQQRSGCCLRCRAKVDKIARSGGTPLAGAGRRAKLLGAIHLKDVVKPASRSALPSCAMGIRTVMVTGDNRLTAAAIAARKPAWTTVLAEATPEKTSSRYSP